MWLIVPAHPALGWLGLRARGTLGCKFFNTVIKQSLFTAIKASEMREGFSLCRYSACCQFRFLRSSSAVSHSVSPNGHSSWWTVVSKSMAARNTATPIKTSLFYKKRPGRLCTHSGPCWQLLKFTRPPSCAQPEHPCRFISDFCFMFFKRLFWHLCFVVDSHFRVLCFDSWHSWGIGGSEILLSLAKKKKEAFFHTQAQK